MRTRRAFRPVVETLSLRLVLSTLATTDPMAPILVPKTSPTVSPLPTDPVKITDTTTTDETYVGSDTSTSIDPPATVNA
ncbi:hypothetical protein [Paludisphaera rhizosphaerae]|uniref:hypothetical protein n=1 Tax=Paludisphaera rhizosphaerae TaxID=2711216 RepID=UPI0013EC470D|nr:hypothetical protein [Paludisphaera rhizosphaerae]